MLVRCREVLRGEVKFNWRMRESRFDGDTNEFPQSLAGQSSSGNNIYVPDFGHKLMTGATLF